MNILKFGTPYAEHRIYIYFISVPLTGNFR